MYGQKDPSQVITRATGAAAIDATYTMLVSGLRLKAVYCHLSSAPTSGGNLTIKLDSVAGSAYDTVLDAKNMVGTTDYTYQPTGVYMDVGDAIDVAYVNTDERTYGVQIVVGE